jgi:hypothetical protein
MVITRQQSIDGPWKEGRERESEEEEDGQMILATLIMNTHGKPRIKKFYQNEPRIGHLSLSSHIDGISQFNIWIVISYLMRALIDDEIVTEFRV